MTLHSYLDFSPANRRTLLILVASHLLWSLAILLLSWGGQGLCTPAPGWSVAFIALQLYAASQLLLPALLFHPERRSRSFYLFWGGSLGLAIWLLNQLPASAPFLPLLAALKSGLLLLTATLTGGALARYVRRLWELLPIGLVMTLADFASWRYGPTRLFTSQIEEHFLAPGTTPPPVEMILVKLALPGSPELAPLFGIADWTMVVFFTIVARRFDVNDNLLGGSGAILAAAERVGCYLPVPVAALFLAILLAQWWGLFLPALPLVSLVVLLWYALRFRRPRSRPPPP